MAPRRGTFEGVTYPVGGKFADAQMDQLNLQRHEFHGDWNYSSQPRRT